MGGQVNALAKHVMSGPECKRLFGPTLWKTKRLNGVVLRVFPHAAKPRSTMIEASYRLPNSMTKARTLNIRSVNNHWSTVEVLEETAATTTATATTTDTATMTDTATTAATTTTAATATATNNTPTSPGGSTVEALPVEDDSVTEEAHDSSKVIKDNDNALCGGSPLIYQRPQTKKTVANEVTWEATDGHEQLNGPVPERELSVQTETGVVLSPSSPEGAVGMSRLDFFLLMFPPHHLMKIIQMTNYQLRKNRRNQTTKQEVIKFFGILILITRFEFSKRSSLWSTTAPSKYIPAACFGNTGMSRCRFDDLFRFIRFSEQPDDRPDGMPFTEYRWKLVDDFEKTFNTHHQENFTPYKERTC